MGCKGIGFGGWVAAEALALMADVSALVTAVLNAMDEVGVMAEVHDLVAEALARVAEVGVAAANVSAAGDGGRRQRPNCWAKGYDKHLKQKQ